MHLPSSMKVRLFVAAILLSLSTISCVKENSLDRMMDEFSGTYTMFEAFVHINRSHQEINLPCLGLPAVSKASVSKAGDRWYFDFNVPVMQNSEAVDYLQMQTEVIWDEAVNSYLFQRLNDTDIRLLGDRPDDLLIEYDGTKHRIRYSYAKDQTYTLLITWQKD